MVFRIFWGERGCSSHPTCYRVGQTWVPATAKRIQRRLQEVWYKFRPDPLLSAAMRVYKGQCASKAETLGHYQFALCFENATLSGWITEKLFDCFFAGAVPVYWGAPDIADYVPAECFIDMREFSDFSDLRNFLKQLGPEDLARYRANAREFLRSGKYTPFRKDAFFQLFRDMVAEDAGVAV